MIRTAIVVQIHPTRRTLDLVYTDTGYRVAEVCCMSSLVASDSGVWDVPSVQKPTSEAQAGALPQGDNRQLVAAVAEAYGRPFVVGFLHPLAGQMAFTQDDRFVRRHSSGAYSTVAPDGSIEVYHPSGAYARIGTGAHEPLAQFSANQNWKEVSDAASPTITLSTSKFSLVVSPDGTVTLNTQKSVNLTATDGVNIHANVAVTGGITATQDIVAGSVSLEHHVHEDDDDGGTGVTGPPV